MSTMPPGHISVRGYVQYLPDTVVSSWLLVAYHGEYLLDIPARFTAVWILPPDSTHPWISRLSTVSQVPDTTVVFNSSWIPW